MNVKENPGVRISARPWSKNALDLIYKRYLLNDKFSVDEWLDNVIARVCHNYKSEQNEVVEQYSYLLKSRAFLPTSAALTNTLSNNGSLAGCIVIELARDMETIFTETLPKIIKMQMAGAGVGLDLSVLPPRLFSDNLDERAHPGAVEWLISIAKAVEGPVQYAGVKRAAFMATLLVNHPDIFEFIMLKSHHRLPSVNTSVAFDQIFKQAVEHEGFFPLMWRDKESQKVMTVDELLKMKNQSRKRSVAEPDLELLANEVVFSRAANRVVGRIAGGIILINAKIVLRFMAEQAHACGDPGLVNLHAINEHNPTHPKYARSSRNVTGVGFMNTTTPCGEQPLLPFEVCHLGSFNLMAFIDENGFNFPAFKNAIKIAVRFMDDLITVGDNGLLEANQMVKANRKIGLGIMGLADTFAELEIPYDSKNALILAEEIGRTLQTTAEAESNSLANERGSFDSWAFSEHKNKEPRRHATLTTIAPTGHIATLADCSTGIEPYYLLSYQRDAAGIKVEHCSVLERKLRTIGFSLEEWIAETRRRCSNYNFDGMLAHLCERPLREEDKNQYLSRLKDIFKTAHEIEPRAHIALVKALQKFIDNGISKTINLPEFTSVQEIEALYREAILSDLKGITVFRDGCLEKQALFRKQACLECDEWLPTRSDELEMLC